MTELICISCPKGCHLKVDEQNDYAVAGNACPRGAVYGENELRNPQRVVTSTVKTNSEEHPRCPVKTNGTIPKGKIFEAVKTLDSVTLKTPVKIGDVVVPNLFGSGVCFVACKNID